VADRSLTGVMYHLWSALKNSWQVVDNSGWLTVRSAHLHSPRAGSIQVLWV